MEKTKVELAIEAAVFRRLVAHLQARVDVQNIDLMNLSGFCRNCLSRWYEEAAEAHGRRVDRETAQRRIYGMSYGTWKARYQKEATKEQQEAFARSRRG